MSQASTVPLASPQLIHKSRMVGPAFWSMMKGLVIIAGTVNLFWTVLFVLLGSKPLALVSVVSACAYAVCYFLIERRKNVAALAIFWIEVPVHIVISSLLIGWESGYHLYLILCIPACLTSASGRRATVPVIVIIVLYLALDALCTLIAPLSPLPMPAVKVVTWLNYVIVFAIFYSMTITYRETITRAERRLFDLAMKDPLTGLSNRSHFNNLFANEMTQSQSTDKAHGLVLIDIDHFKRINDQFGHEAGDQVLVSVAKTLSANLNEGDILARWGGEEFLILLRDSSAQNTLAIAEKIRRSVCSRNIAIESKDNTITISAGATQIETNETLTDALRRADKGLYASKDGGRNQVTARPCAQASDITQDLKPGAPLVTI